MTKSSIKRISILGLVLTAASAVTAAVLPSNNNDSQIDDLVAGSLTQHSSSQNLGNDSSVTCAPIDAQDQNQNCNQSTGAGSSTSDPVLGGSTTISSTAGGAGEGAGAGQTTDAA